MPKDELTLLTFATWASRANDKDMDIEPKPNMYKAEGLLMKSSA